MIAWRDRKRFTTVLGHQMAHVEMGQGRPIVFLHGNPTSSFLWRDVMAAVGEHAGRLLAPDLIGMGDSDKLPDSGPDRYRFVEHAEYLDGWFDAVVPDGKVILVVHDWGGALGFNWARRHSERIAGVAYMETIVRAMTWDEWPDLVTPLFQAFRSPAGEEMILEKNVFVEKVLTGSILRDLTEDEMTEYRRPFSAPGESRRPTLTWPRQIPLSGDPEDVCAIADANHEWLRTSQVPKLFVNAEPAAILVGPVRDSARGLPNQTEITVAGSHFIQEDSGTQIGRAIADWIDQHQI
ncbi:MAG: haloalkane dehalogenase [Pseudomonadota bacterium]